MLIKGGMDMIPYIDLHCDTLMEAWLQKKQTILEFPEAMIDVKRLKQGGCKAQFFAIFMLTEDMKQKSGVLVDDDCYIAALRDIFLRSCGDDLAPAGSMEELRSNEAEGKISGILTLEDGRAVNGSLEKLEAFYQMGIRLISLTWNFENCFGYPNSGDSRIMERGLKPFGRDAVCRMQELGMLVDVSHLSDGGFRDVAVLAKKPFVASHSNCRALNPHSRSMTDEMIRTLADHGGVMGVNFAPGFLTADPASRVSRVEDLVRHVQHMVNVGGLEIAAVGSDLDGITGQLEIGSADNMPLLFDALDRAGFSDDAIEKIACLNAERVWMSL